MPPKILVITGPTATGKTRLGILLAKKLGGEIISADSMQVYRGMDIGTAKPTVAEMEGVPHHMLDVAEPAEEFSAARYVAEASRCADRILYAGGLPIIVGGTGLYIEALLAGRKFAGHGTGGALRKELEARFDEDGGALLAELARIDPETAGKLHPNDRKRIVRAMEVYLQTGKPISVHNRESRRLPPRYEALKIALNYRDREVLYGEIDRRVDRMVEAGLEDEVRRLLAAGAPPSGTAMQAIGYKEMAAALSGTAALAEVVEKIKRESRRYAKRQLSWLRRDQAIKWILWDKIPDYGQAIQISTQKIKNFWYNRVI